MESARWKDKGSEVPTLCEAVKPYRKALVSAMKGAASLLREEGPFSTVDAREMLGVAHPAARAHDLRKQGFAIATQRAKALDAWGCPHTVALYVLLEGLDILR